jgi:23S rRNA (adenine2503-C2)-methyltransferase
MLYYAETTKRDITYEYTLLSGINDTREHAKELSALLQGQQCTVNLIPYNPVQGLRLKRPEKEVIEEFREILTESGINTTWRYTKGTARSTKELEHYLFNRYYVRIPMI